MKKLTNQLSREALAVKVQLQEFNQNRRMIRNLLDEKKQLQEMCDMLKSSGSVMSEGGESFSKQEQYLFRLEDIDTRLSELITKTANTENILLSAIETLPTTEANMLLERYANGKSITKLCQDFYYSERHLKRKYMNLFNKLIPLVIKQDELNEKMQDIEALNG